MISKKTPEELRILLELRRSGATTPSVNKKKYNRRKMSVPPARIK